MSSVQRNWARLAWVLVTNGALGLLLINGIKSRTELTEIANVGRNAWLQDPSQWFSLSVLLLGLLAEAVKSPLAKYLNVGFFFLASAVLGAESIHSLIQLRRGMPGYYAGESGIGVAICLIFMVITVVNIILYWNSRSSLAIS